MNRPTILNREFQHPSDGWYQIEALGQHPNQAARVIQVIDAESATSIVNRFNQDAAAGRLRHGAELLIDHEHFSDQPDQETRAYGWLQELKNREDGIYGRIRWTKTGREAVDGGDYRFFSTEYDSADLAALNAEKPRRVRPLRLGGLTLTNMHNNRGQKPITNRDDQSHQGNPAPVASTQPKPMKSIATKLGLAAEASEDAILASVTNILNRVATFEAEEPKLKNRITALEKDNGTLLGEQVDGLLDAHGVADDKVRNRLKPVITAIGNREERVAALVDFGYAAGGKAAPGAPSGRTLNRSEARPPGAPATKPAATADPREQAEKQRVEVESYRIANRCTFAQAHDQVRRLKPELFATAANN